MSEPIAIVGLGGVLPGATKLDDFWRVVERGVDTASEPPPGRWKLDLDQAYTAARAVPDRVYSRKACFVRDFELDPSGLELPPELLDTLDPMVHLALHAGRQAWLDSATDPVDPARVGVMLGNIVLPTAAASAMADWIIGRRFERELFRAAGIAMPPEDRAPVAVINRWVAGLPAAMLARALGLGGDRFCLDAACASSLFAVELAVDALRQGRLDAVLAGGLARPDSLYTQMGFSQLLAVSPTGRCSPFDHKADGLVVGEGAGVLVLKRLSDAWLHGDRIRAVIHSVGLSNDVEGSLLAPSREGQIRAMQGAYLDAGWRPGEVDLIECHATGTPVGDSVEFASLQELWSEEERTRKPCVIGSAKSNTGHLLTGAGAVGLLKTVLAMEKEVLPPTANFEQSGDKIDLAGGPFRVLSSAEPWQSPSSHPRRAAVSGFGFGGTNAHVLLEEPTDPTRGRSTVSVPTSVADGDVVAPPSKARLAIVGMDAHVGPWKGLAELRARLMGRGREHPVRPKENHWGLPDAPAGWFIEELEIPLGRFKIPPKEIEEALSQQMLMLQVAERAIADAELGDVDRLRTGVFIGVELDLNTTNYHLRWALRARAADWARRLGREDVGEEFERWVGELTDNLTPALNANRTIGGLGSIVASRIAREFGLGGPSYVLSSEETSGLSALHAAVRALDAGRIDCAVVGAVDLAGDVRSLISLAGVGGLGTDLDSHPFERDSAGIIPSDGAAALVLKREDDARRNGGRIYAVVRGIGSAGGGSLQSYAEAIRRGLEDAGLAASDIPYVETHGCGIPSEDRLEMAALSETFSADTILGCSKALVGHAGAAAGLISLMSATLSLHHEVLPSAAPRRRRDPPGDATGEMQTTGLGNGVVRGLTRMTEPTPWVRDRCDGARRAGILAVSRGGSSCHVILEAPEVGTPDEHRPWAPEPMSEGLFAIDGDDVGAIIEALRELAKLAAAAESAATVESTESTPIFTLARNWRKSRPLRSDATLAIALVARDVDELKGLASKAADHLERGEDPSDRSAGRAFFSREPLGPTGELAFVYPGSGSQYPGMGRELCLQWPEILRAQDRSNTSLKSQLKVDEIWHDGLGTTDARTVILSQVTLGTIATDLMASFGVRPDAVVGYSLGETAGLFSMGAWDQRDEMLRRVTESTLFESELTGPCNAARRAWGLAQDSPVDWRVGVVGAPAEQVRDVLGDIDRVYLLIVNTPDECVIGGEASALARAVALLGSAFHPLEGVTTVHCDVAKEVEREYRDLHVLDTHQPEGVRFYSGAWGESYEVSQDRAADSILAQAIQGVDFPKTVRQAYEDGVRIFLEMGPGGSCARMIHKILEGMPFRARSISAPTQDEPSAVLRALAMLIAERVPVDLARLYPAVQDPEVESGPVIRVPVGQKGFELDTLAGVPGEDLRESERAVGDERRHPALDTASPTAGVPSELSAAVRVAENTVKAHEAFLRSARRTQELAEIQLAKQGELIRALTAGGDTTFVLDPAPTIVMDRDQLMEFAIGSIGRALGPRFAHVDHHPTRVRLPDEPLMLVDRVTKIEAEAGSMTSGRIVTEHDVLEGGWYLDGGRIPTCVGVEAGQADLLLSGYLGIDSETKGLAVYRLLDAVVTFHSELARPGQVIEYDIRILHFFQQGDTWLFRFQFDSTVDGRPLLTMREGTAGFFTQAELEAGKGIVQSAVEQQERAGRRPVDWRDLVPMRKDALDEARLETLRAGDLVGAFGEAFSGLAVDRPLTIPGGRMRLVHRVTDLDPEGGRYGIGGIVAEADIHPDDWFLTCHFSDDQVMPGTLMYECCLHTLRIFLLRMGWIAEEAGATWQPVPKVRSRLRCRGQVLATTRMVTYEIHVRELGYRPEPYAIVDALMYADGKPVVEIRDMSVRLTGTDRQRLEAMWAERGAPVLYDRDSILAFSTGKPSEAFGEPYRIFDEGERRIARLPRPPYQFLDRITAVEGEPFVMREGAKATAEFDLSPDHWYFESNRQREIPFAVLLEVALQPCGWLAAYVGSALTSEDDLRFRNLGGEATHLARLTTLEGVIRTQVELTGVSTSGGMIIQRYAMALESDRHGPLYEGTTYFGFFSDRALADQVGIRGAPIHEPDQSERERGHSLMVPHTAPFPDERFRMVDRIELLVPDGGADALGWIHGSIAVDPAAWFFEAHFYQDPVWPGSLGLEAFVQLLKVYAVDRWDLGEDTEFAMTTGPDPHRWTYRGQIIPGSELVHVFASITDVDDAHRRVRADGFLTVDGRTIYSMNDFSLDCY